MTAHKYFSIVFQWQLTDRHVAAMIAVSWLLPLLLTLMYATSIQIDMFIGLQVSNNYCMVALDHATKGGIIILVFIVGTLFILVFAHWHIIIKYRQWKKESEDEEDKMKKEGILIKKSIAIIGIFSITWSLYIVQIVYEIGTHKQVPAEYDIFWELVGVSAPILNLVILSIYDAKFKRNIMALPFVNFSTKRKDSSLATKDMPVDVLDRSPILKLPNLGGNQSNVSTVIIKQNHFLSSQVDTHRNQNNFLSSPLDKRNYHPFSPVLADTHMKGNFSPTEMKPSI